LSEGCCWERAAWPAAERGRDLGLAVPSPAGDRFAQPARARAAKRGNSRRPLRLRSRPSPLQTPVVDGFSVAIRVKCITAIAVLPQLEPETRRHPAACPVHVQKRIKSGNQKPYQPHN